MTASAHIPPGWVTGKVALAGPDWALRTTLAVPKGPMGLIELLPVVASYGDAVAASAATVTEAADSWQGDERSPRGVSHANPGGRHQEIPEVRGLRECQAARGREG